MDNAAIGDGLNDLRNEALEAIARGGHLSEVADRLCRRADTLAPTGACSIVTVDENGLIHHLAGPSLSDNYGKAIEGLPIGPAAGSCGTSAFRGEPVEVIDIETDPLWADYKNLVLPLGYKACWASPIKARDGRVIGSFAFYYRAQRGPTALERQIVETCLDICAIAIEHAEAQDRIERLAYYDVLTGLPNRARFQSEMLRRLGRSTIFNLLIADIDDFRGINDSLGHLFGDRLLQTVAQRLEALLDEDCFLARLGGDEFAIWQPCSDNAADGRRLAEALLAAFEEPFDIDGRVIAAGVSIGIVQAPADGAELQRLASRADLALYAAKADGRNTYRFFAPEMEAGLQARRDLAEDLRNAIARDELSVVYQPIVLLETGALFGFEALLRWNHHDRGAIPPWEFIPLAEEAGMIGALGDWVLAEACREAATWPPGIRVSVNLSPVQLRKPGFAVDVIRVLARSGISPGRLKLEITETALLGEDSMTRETLAALKRIGVGISLDDFGTGFSSLSHLRLMPLDRIKIDMSFIAGIGKDDGSAAIVRAVLALARDLGLKTTAEGVETEEQRNWLHQNGCDEGQGYLFGRPEGRSEARKRMSGKAAGAPRKVVNPPR